MSQVKSLTHRFRLVPLCVVLEQSPRSGPFDLPEKPQISGWTQFRDPALAKLQTRHVIRTKSHRRNSDLGAKVFFVEFVWSYKRASSAADVDPNVRQRVDFVRIIRHKFDRLDAQILYTQRDLAIENLQVDH
jgi:hypothetical protein